MRVIRLFAVPLLALGVLFGASQQADARSQTITQIAAGDPQFSTLVTALKAAGLAGVLNKRGRYTVFAPTNRAFAKLPRGTVKNLLKPKNRGKLKKILLYHVLGKKVFAEDIPRHPIRVKTLNGKKITATRHGRRVRINNARVTTGNILARNGVIHVINRVLLP